MIANQEGHDEVVPLLIAAGANVNHARNYGVNALIQASQIRRAKAVSFLIAAEAHINHAKNHGVTALIYANQEDRDEVDSMLISAGANVIMHVMMVLVLS